jgi:uncharacterized repeat protein (TIGR03803 family)
MHTYNFRSAFHQGRGGLSMNFILRKHRKNSFLLPALIAGLALIQGGRVIAQTVATLYSFTNYSYAQSSLSMVSKTAYGTTEDGGSLGGGSVFAVNTDGTGFTNLHSFTNPSGGPPYANGDGMTPYAKVILSGGILYGTAAQGGSAGDGVVFAVNTNGAGFTNMHSFSGGDGISPYAGLLLLEKTLYGTAHSAAAGFGSVFAINTDGSGFTNLYNFTNGTDGALPIGGLISSGNTLYGTTEDGGSNGTGTIFAINTDGSGFTNLYNFSAIPVPAYQSNFDGANPESSLIICGNILFGTACKGGAGGNGTVFSVHTDGTGFTNLHSFAPPPTSFLVDTNTDGEFPYATLLLKGNVLYGAAVNGGSTGKGTLFALNTDGTGFTILHAFKGGSDGYEPYGGLVISDNILYGTTAQGGSNGYGSVFSLTLPAPQLTITTSGSNVILTWPTNVAGFDYTGYTLQATTNLISPSWSAVSPTPVVVNGLETVTNVISGTQMFYRLYQ